MWFQLVMVFAQMYSSFWVSVLGIVPKPKYREVPMLREIRKGRADLKSQLAQKSPTYMNKLKTL
jgi:hypothetical protein